MPAISMRLKRKIKLAIAWSEKSLKSLIYNFFIFTFYYWNSSRQIRWIIFKLCYVHVSCCEHYIFTFYICIIIHYMHEIYTIYAWNINLFWRKERKASSMWKTISQKHFILSYWWNKHIFIREYTKGSNNCTLSNKKCRNI